MRKILNITSKNVLLEKVNELEVLVNKLTNDVSGVRLTLSSVSNYDKELDIVSTGNNLVKEFVHISNNIETTTLNIKSYINDLIEFDKFELDVDDVITNNSKNIK